MSYNYIIAGVKETPNENDPISFGVILKDMPEYEGYVFMYDDLTFVDSGEDISIQVGFACIEPGGAKKRQAEMKPEVVELMTELIQQVSNDIITARYRDEVSKEAERG